MSLKTEERVARSFFSKSCCRRQHISSFSPSYLSKIALDSYKVSQILYATRDETHKNLFLSLGTHHTGDGNIGDELRMK